MKSCRTISVLLPLCALAALCLLPGCKTVDEGPALPPDPTAQNEIRGVEPQHAPIPTKNVPEGESSLSHTKGDQRIDQPNK